MQVLCDGIIFAMQQQGGISRVFTEIVRGIAHSHRNVEFTVHLPAKASNPLAGDDGIAFVRDLAIRPWRLRQPINLWRLKRKARQAQVFHSSYYTLPYWSGMKTVVTVHDFIHEKYQALLPDPQFILQKREVISSADAVVAVSETTRNEILKFCPVKEERVMVAHLGVSDSFLLGPASPEEVAAFVDHHRLTKPYWMFVGGRHAYKNFGVVVKAFATVASSTGGSLLVVGGDPRLEPSQVDHLIAHRCERQVTLVRGLTDKDLRIAYSGAAGFIFSSLDEGFGLPLLEAMTCGAPVIASDIPVFHEVAGQAASYFDPHSEEDLAAAMLLVLGSGVAVPLIAEGRQRASEFSWDNTARQYAEIYRNII